MSLWFRGTRQEERATQWAPVPYPALAPSSYVDVNLSSAESAMQSIAVRGAIDLIASLASELPAEVYSGTGTDRVRRPTPSYLLDPAGDGQGLPDWCYQVVESWLLRGNVYGDVLDHRGTCPTQIQLLHPDDVSGWIDENGTVHWSVTGRPVNPDRWLHQRVNPVPGRVLGLSPVAWHAATIGLSITSVRFGESWFRDGAHPSALLTNEEATLNEDQARQAKHRFLAALRGTREPVVLGKGWKYQQIQISPEESQFLATQGYTEAQCARIFGPGIAEVLGYESGGSMTYSNVESRSTHLLVYSVNKWLSRLERLLSSMLPRPQYVRIDRDGLLQSTTLERYRANEIALRNRWKTVNEVRQSEGDLPPVPWGNEPNPTSPAPPGGAHPDEHDDDQEDGS
ncbi:phage portal protein, HK97 family [Saccharopolyspora antimicrobica]|uniref:HK97 family phage portal protein n=2 Tax=Saccharopolyspora antimicrobica TaxID=455193 RepID=A0A1I4YLD4_9PSEU|nr:HK97 family phage portal protein [Saccharopolyspora antimicrobica]SFN38862.1 phage portal protein, HK97 family [Saccharopolyspora antimicrobica]